MPKRPSKRGYELLRRFLTDHEVTMEAASEAIGTTKASMSLWATGQNQPRTEFRMAIEKWTRGEVPATSWMTSHDRKVVDRVRPHRAARKAQS